MSGVLVGSEVYTSGAGEEYWSAANDTIIRELEFYDGALDALDTTPPEAVTRLIADAAWGGENEISWTASASNDSWRGGTGVSKVRTSVSRSVLR